MSRATSEIHSLGRDVQAAEEGDPMPNNQTAAPTGAEQQRTPMAAATGRIVSAGPNQVLGRGAMTEVRLVPARRN